MSRPFGLGRKRVRRCEGRDHDLDISVSSHPSVNDSSGGMVSSQFPLLPANCLSLFFAQPFSDELLTDVVEKHEHSEGGRGCLRSISCQQMAIDYTGLYG